MTIIVGYLYSSVELLVLTKLEMNPLCVLSVLDTCIILFNI
jgi:hypothetical protein